MAYMCKGKDCPRNFECAQVYSYQRYFEDTHEANPKNDEENGIYVINEKECIAKGYKNGDFEFPLKRKDLEDIRFFLKQNIHQRWYEDIDSCIRKKNYETLIQYLNVAQFYVCKCKRQLRKAMKDRENKNKKK